MKKLLMTFAADYAHLLAKETGDDQKSYRLPFLFFWF